MLVDVHHERFNRRALPLALGLFRNIPSSLARACFFSCTVVSARTLKSAYRAARHPAYSAYSIFAAIDLPWLVHGVASWLVVFFTIALLVYRSSVEFERARDPLTGMRPAAGPEVVPPSSAETAAGWIDGHEASVADFLSWA
jgi:hypothetical protein